ncbi:hypothetical protein AK812_SmicGene39084 [Symbiodinium microadriaticum]|uniref:Methyltransferase FkbM domain-containing protein n=1 Tax=Symbiodinium microadriaticum TaxID=2951 RepID=A0A1Q9CC50_SYMMI|nr:hypothetical protein AK812_SmicGene39084 [Symbiodinium microadriaticum]
MRSENFDAKPKKEWKETLSYTTTSLASVLRQFGAPSQIDFLSLDVEGAESLVMKNFPWDTYTFSVLNVERPKPDLKQWLGDNGCCEGKVDGKWTPGRKGLELGQVTNTRGMQSPLAAGMLGSVKVATTENAQESHAKGTLREHGDCHISIAACLVTFDMP